MMQIRTLAEQMSLNMVQEETLARQDAEFKVERQQLIIRLLIAILVILLTAGLVIALLL